MTPRDHQRLVGVHPALVEALIEVFAEMDAWGHPMFVVEGVRSTERQQHLYAQGRTIGGPIVTHADGVKERSNHQVHSDGWGHAVDCAFQDGNPFAESHPWERYGAALEARGVNWGGRWRFMDKPHAEWIDSEAKKA